MSFLETSAKETINTEELFTFTMTSFLDKVNTYGRKNEFAKRNTLVIDIDKVEDKKDNCCLK